MDDPLCRSDEEPDLKYHPKALGQIQIKSQKPSVVAGKFFILLVDLKVES